MKIFAIDPGSEESSYVVWDPPTETVAEHGYNVRNDLLLHKIRALEEHQYLVLERIQSRGMIVGQETFDTAEFVGTLAEAYAHKYLVHKLFRQKVRIHFCGTANCGDPNVRRAVIDRFGGENKAIGGVKCPKCKGKGWFGSGRPVCPECGGKKWKHVPGKLLGLKDDEWQALALALCFFDTALTGREKGGNE
jgi:hypothetical protein